MADNKVLLLGSYGQTNLGDDVLMYNYLAYLRANGFQDAQIYVNVSTSEFIPAAVKSTFPDINMVNTYQTSILKWVKILKDIDVVVYGGGTIYKELYASTGRGKYSVIGRILLFNAVAFCFGKRIYNLHIGLGSIKTYIGRKITKHGLQACAYTIFRDKKSYDYATTVLKVPSRRLAYSTDGIFINPIWQNAWNAATTEVPSAGYKKVVGINLLSDIPDWVDRTEYIKATTAFALRLLDDNNYIIFMPFQHNFNLSNDYVFMQENILPALKGRSGFTLLRSMPLDQLNAYFQAVDIFVGMRFHSLLLATITRTPFLAITYDTKCQRFIEDASYDHAVALESLSAAKINQAYDDLCSDTAATQSKLEEMGLYNFKQVHKCLDNIKL